MSDLSVSLAPIMPTRLLLSAAGTAQPADLPAPNAEIDAVLSKAWDHYKKTMIAADGRPLGDHDDNDIDGDGDHSERVTVSEAVSYVLLRAAWMNDKAAFDKTWRWAEKNLQRKNLGQVYFWNQAKWTAPPQQDNLFAWRYVPTLKGKEGGVINYKWKGENVWRGCFEGASDADLDITAALIFAGSRWKDQAYTTSARAILGDIWDKYVDYIKPGKPVLYGGDQFKGTEVNPSYLRPAYYKMFAAVDPNHPWNELFNTSYQVIVKSGDLELGGVNPTTNLPPNWLAVRKSGFSDSPTFKSQGGDLFGWDAFRTLFWVAEDYAWNGTAEAKKYLTDNTCTKADTGPYCFLNKISMNMSGHLFAGYRRDGAFAPPEGWWANNLNTEQHGMDGAYLSYFHFAGNKTGSKQIYDALQKMWNEEGYWGDNPNDYYGQNWAWFGLALVSGRAVNLFNPGKGVVPPTPQPKPASPTPEPAKPAAEPTPTAPASGALTIEKIQTSNYGFNGATFKAAQPGTYLFSATNAKDAGAGFATGKTDLGARKTLKFEIKGTLKTEESWGRLQVQVYKTTDNDSEPVIFKDLDSPLSRDKFSPVTLGVSEISRVKKIQFMLIGQGSCQVEIKSLRFE